MPYGTAMNICAQTKQAIQWNCNQKSAECGSHELSPIRGILLLNGTFHRELVPYDFPLVVLHRKVVICFCLWCNLGDNVKFKFRATYSGSLMSKLILAPLGMPNMSNTNIEWSLSNLHTTSKHALITYSTWKVLYAKQLNPKEKSCWVRA